MSVFGDIVRESRYIDNKIYVSFDEKNYRRLELKLEAQEQEIERLNNIIKEVRKILLKRKHVENLMGGVELSNTDKMLQILDKEKE